MVPILLYHAFKATTPFVDAFVNERLRQLLPSTNDCLLQFSDRRKLSRRCDVIKADDNEQVSKKISAILSLNSVMEFSRCLRKGAWDSAIF